MAVYQEKDKKKWTKDGRKWYYRCYYTDIRGSRKQKISKMYETKKQAEQEERLFLTNASTTAPTPDITVEQLINDYLIYQKDKVKVSTYQDLQKRIKKFKPLLNIKLKDLNIKHFELWKTEINNNDKNYKTSYKNTLYKHFRALLNFAIKYYDMFFLTSLINKMTNFSNPNEMKDEMKFFTYDEFKDFIVLENDLKYKCFYETLYFCGLRKGEANALNWNDIDFDNKTLSINKNVILKIIGEKYTIVPPKTKSSIRTLPIPQNLADDLQELKKHYQQYSNFSSSWFVFGGLFPLQDTTIQSRKDEHCKEIGKTIRIHDFRHSCASLLINNGATISLVAKYLGHSKISTTLNTYTHMFKNQFDDIVEVINKLN